MKKYIVEFTETLQRQVEIEANSPEEAEDIARAKYKAEEIVLDSSDFVGGDIRTEVTLTTEMEERLDEVHNTVYETILTLTELDNEQLDWDIEIIGGVLDAIVDYLANEHSLNVRYPAVVADPDGSKYLVGSLRDE
jgi:hypothetical protein